MLQRCVALKIVVANRLVKDHLYSSLIAAGLSVAYHGNKGRPFRSALPRADYCENYALYSLSVFSLAKSLQRILEISATYRLIS